MRKYLIILFSLFSLLASAGTYYVSTTGTNGAYPTRGTLANPWLTWQYAMDNSTAGDTVYFRGGTYYVTARVYKSTNGGSAGNPICYFAYPADWATGNYPILDGRNKTTGSAGLVFEGISYIHLKGLHVYNHEQKNDDEWEVNGMTFIEGNNFYVENCVVNNSGFRGFDLNGLGSSTFINCDSWNNVDHLTTITPAGNHGQGFCITDYPAATIMPGDTVFIIGCRAAGNSDDGFASNMGNIQIWRNCWAWDNGRLNGGSGIGFKYGPAAYMGTDILSRYIHNCISAYNIYKGNQPGEVGGGFHSNDNDFNYFNYDVDNNLSVGDPVGFGSLAAAGQPSRTVRRIRNNVAVLGDASHDWSYDNYPTDTYNSWNTPPGVTANASDFVSLDTAQLRGARKADGSLPDITFGKLVEGSDLIDAGTDVGLAYEGTAPDLGYVEYAEGAASDATDILSFTFTEQTGAATINTTLHTVSIEVEWDAVITSLTPTITVSGGATIDPTSGTARNFTSPVTYTVTAEDTVTEQVWTVTVTQESEPEVPATNTSQTVKYRGKILKR